MSTLKEQARYWISRLHAAARKLPSPAQFMEVCGTHTVSAFRCGLHSLMPDNVRLLSGPGCPVCVTSQGDIDQLIALGTDPTITLCTYGDMLRVTGSNRMSLESARSAGADVRVIYSALDAVRLAEKCQDQQFVLAGVGFETTTPATAIAVLEAQKRGLKNFSVYTSHKLVLPAMRALLRSEDLRIDGFLCPGHVSVIIGSNTYRKIVARYGKPCVIVGFEDFQMAQGLALLTEMLVAQSPQLMNLYPQAVTKRGNQVARDALSRVFTSRAARWRGLGELPHSGLVLRDAFAAYDARKRFNLACADSPEPPGCRCGDVITGRCTPAECKLFGRTCTPINPIGPCMVSSEGTCQAWFKYNRRREAVSVGGEA